MSLRIFSAVPLLLVAACGGPAETAAPGDPQVDVATGTPAGEPVERIACAIGDADYADVCSIDRARARDGTVLTIRHPDGGFRRLNLSADGQTVSAADGAAPVEVLARGEGGTEVAIADVRYRLPAIR